MEYVLLIIGFSCMLLGIAGSLLPALPGLPVSWLGLLLLYFVPQIEFDYWTLGITLFFTIALLILDYIIPAQGTKRFGGSQYGIWGTNIGLIVGFFAPIPFGIIIGPFLGALIGEFLYDNQNPDRALKAATGSFIGFLASTFIKLIVSLVYLGLFLSIAWKHKAIWL